jgi:hypothetical protein
LKNILSIACILFSISLSSFGQQVSETGFSIGVNSPTHYDQDEFSVTYMPNNPIFNVTKSWYNNEHWISLRKELGLNLQYLNVRYGIGNLERDNYFSGNMVSLFANGALMAHLRIDRKLVFSIGPEAEILLIEKNNLKNSYKTSFPNPPSSGTIIEKGFSRAYFSQPSYGIKARLFESNITQRITLCLAVSYLWTKRELSNFNASNYTRLSFYIGSRSLKKS